MSDERFTPTTEDVSAVYGRDADEVAEFDRWLSAHDAKVRADTLEEAGALMDRNVKTLSAGIDAAVASGVEFTDDEKFAATEAVAMLERISVAIRFLAAPTERTH